MSSSINALAAVAVEDIVKPHFTTLTDEQLSRISMGMSKFTQVLNSDLNFFSPVLVELIIKNVQEIRIGFMAFGCNNLSNLSEIF